VDTDVQEAAYARAEGERDDHDRPVRRRGFVPEAMEGYQGRGLFKKRGRGRIAKDPSPAGLIAASGDYEQQRLPLLPSAQVCPQLFHEQALRRPARGWSRP
jgi:hypothetical protein